MDPILLLGLGVAGAVVRSLSRTKTPTTLESSGSTNASTNVVAPATVTDTNTSAAAATIVATTTDATVLSNVVTTPSGGGGGVGGGGGGGGGEGREEKESTSNLASARTVVSGRGLFIGINYESIPGMRLHGCVPDARKMHALVPGLASMVTKLMIDTVPNAVALPTRHNIAEAVKWAMAPPSALVSREVIAQLRAAKQRRGDPTKQLRDRPSSSRGEGKHTGGRSGVGGGGGGSGSGGGRGGDNGGGGGGSGSRGGDVFLLPSHLAFERACARANPYPSQTLANPNSVIVVGVTRAVDDTHHQQRLPNRQRRQHQNSRKPSPFSSSPLSSLSSPPSFPARYRGDTTGFGRLNPGSASVLPVSDSTAMVQLARSVANVVAPVFIHYSGHGTYRRDTSRDEADGYDECLVALDGVMTDDELCALIVEATIPGQQVVCVFDQCHAGTILDLPYVYKPDTSSKSIAMTVDHLAKKRLVERLVARQSTSLVSSEADLANLNVLCISACGDRELAAELGSSGLLTSCLAQVVEEAHLARESMTYRTLMMRVSAMMFKRVGRIQTMQFGSICPVDLDLPVPVLSWSLSV